jgi:uncharacterized protein with HEPN domain
MRSDDVIRVCHMLEAAREALAFVENQTRADLDANRLLALGLMKCIEIIGEAASKISQEGRQAYPRILWVDIIGMRNRLVHAYVDVDLDILWETVMHDLPSLIPLLDAILAKETPVRTP